MAGPVTKEHVFPSCLYPKSLANSKVQRLTIPACESCNNGWSDKEVQFRNVLLLSGEVTGPVSEQWTVLKRSLAQKDGERRRRELLTHLVPAVVDEEERFKIYPARDPSTQTVLRKIVRGLSYYHGLGTVTDERLVWADVLRFPMQPDLMEAMESHHREADIVKYSLASGVTVQPFQSAWLLTFFESRTFVAIVDSEQSFKERA